MNTDNFEPFAKIARLSRECVITEKIDGTNAQIFIWDMSHQPKNRDGTLQAPVGSPPDNIPFIYSDGPIYIAVGSKNRWITPESDNFGFAAWVKQNAGNLAWLGHGKHFGEWWGAGIQRNYGLKEKRFSLFNTERWKPAPDYQGIFFDSTVILLQNLSVVPVLQRSIFDSRMTDLITEQLRLNGSVAAPGFMKPEGIVIWHTAARMLFKKTIEGDEKPKGQVE